MLKIYHKYHKEFRANTILALPIITGQAGQILVNVIDTLMVGRLGSTALAAISTGNSIVSIFMVFGMGLSFALTPLVAEADGAKEYKNVANNLKHMAIINLSFAVFSIVALWIASLILPKIGLPIDVVDGANDYIYYSALSFIPYMLFLSLRGLSDGLSRTEYAMGAIIIGNILNVIFNYLFIYGTFGFPRLGIGGAALGSLLARIGMFLIMVYFLRNNDVIWQFVKEAKHRILEKIVFIKILNLGVPSSLQLLFEVSAFSIAAIIMGLVGKQEQAAHHIAINMATITFMLCSGLGMAASIRVGNAMGANDPKGIRMAGMSAIIQVTLFMVVAAMIFAVFRHALPSLYINDHSVEVLAAYLLLFAAIFQIPDGLQAVGIGILRGLQDVKYPTWITFFAYWFIGLPISYILAITFRWGASGVWMGLLIGLSISATLLIWRFSNKVKPEVSN